MQLINNNKDFAANVLYNDAVEEEKKWRNDIRNLHDVALVDELLCKARKIGYKYKYYADLTHRDNTAKELYDVILPYIGRFDDEWISAELISVIGKKGNTDATETIVNNFFNSSEKNKYMNAGFYDNALYRIKDKRFLSAYINLLKMPEYANKFPLTMIMLGRWRIEEAKNYFFQYLNLYNEINTEKTSNLVYISLEALSYYKDIDGSILKAFESKLYSSNKNITIAAEKSIKRLKKNNSN